MSALVMSPGGAGVELVAWRRHPVENGSLTGAMRSNRRGWWMEVDAMPESSSWATSEATRRSMQGNRGRDTGPEIAVRRIVHSRGLRYRVDARPLPALNRRADLVFSRAMVAVFIDGCFWHGCPDHHTVAKANATYWAEKVAGNRLRDLDTSERLTDSGWLVLRFWEHESPDEVAEAIIHAVQDRRGGIVRPDRPD